MKCLFVIISILKIVRLFKRLECLDRVDLNLFIFFLSMLFELLCTRYFFEWFELFVSTLIQFFVSALFENLSGRNLLLNFIWLCILEFHMKTFLSLTGLINLYFLVSFTHSIVIFCNCII